MSRILISFRKVLLALGCIGAVTASAQGQEAPSNSEDYCKVVELIERMADLSEEGQKHLNRAAFESEALVDRLDYDADIMIDFVRNSISFEQYPGTLRGPRGTVLGLAGNALDQSVLLAKLLRDAGYDARVAMATLTKEQTTELLGQIRAARGQPLSVGDATELGRILSEMSDGAAEPSDISANLLSPPDPTQSVHFREVIDTNQMLATEIKGKMSWSEVSANPQILMKEAAEYYWVQIRDSAASPWRDVHPAFEGADPENPPEAEGYLADSVPAEIQHRLRIQIFIERLAGQKLEVIPVSEAWERPVANLLDVPLTVANIPDSLTMSRAMQGDSGESASSAGFFIPMFNGEQAPGVKFFDLEGKTIDPMVASDQAAGIFEEMGRAFGQATEAMGGVRPALTAQWLELTLISPGGEEQVFRRTTFDRLGSAVRRSGQLRDKLSPTTPEQTRALLKRHTIMVTAAETPTALRLERMFEQNIRMKPVFLDLLSYLQASASGESELPIPQHVDSPPNYWAGHLSLFSALDVANYLSDSHRIYRSAPSVIIHSQGPDEESGASEMIDIVTNPRRAVDVSGEARTLDPKMVMMAGIWDTAHEGALLREGASNLNTALVFNEAQAAGTGLKYLAPGQSVDSLDANDDIKADVANDLETGFAVLIPERQSDPRRAGWWRIHTATGETVGQINGGRGAEVLEYLLMERPALEALSTYGFLALGLAECLQNAHNCSEQSRRSGSCQASSLCCMAVNTVAWGIGFAFAGIVSIGWDFATFHMDVCPSP